MQFWNELEGRVFDGFYPLRRLMRSEGRTAWFETETGKGERASISLTESLTDADEVVKRLEAAQRLENPHLVAISKIGRARFENTLFVYAVMEYTEQNLAEVLAGQPLSKEDVQQVAEALVGALTAIHQRGLLHGRVEPASVLAVGETVKLRSDCLQTPGSTRAGDVAGLGATLFQAFTQRKAEKADDGQINRLPAPFAEIVRNSLSSRWSLGQVAAALRPPAAAAAASVAAQPPAIPANPPSTETAAPNPVPGKEASAAEEPLRSAPPVAKTAATSVVLRDEEDADGKASKSFKPIAVALVVVLLLIVLWVTMRPKTHSTPHSTAAVAGNSPQASSPAAAPPQDPGAPAAPPAPAQPAAAQAAKPSPARSVPQQTETTAAAVAGAGANTSVSRPVWRVIAYTYNREDQAQQKTAEILQQHADLQASVVPLPAGGRSRFLVTIGGAMNRSQALALRDKAAGMGLPADTYVQNFPQ